MRDSEFLSGYRRTSVSRAHRLRSSWRGTGRMALRRRAEPKPTVALINLAAVSCKSATACVVVGTYMTLAGAGTARPYAMTWNGTSLTPTAAPPVPKDSSFAP